MTNSRQPPVAGRVVEHAERAVAGAGQLGGGVDDPLQRDVQVEIGGDRADGLQDRAQRRTPAASAVVRRLGIHVSRSVTVRLAIGLAARRPDGGSHGLAPRAAVHARGQDHGRRDRLRAAARAMVVPDGHGRRAGPRGAHDSGRRRVHRRTDGAATSTSWSSPTTRSTPGATCGPGCWPAGWTSRRTGSGPPRWRPRSSWIRSGRAAARSSSARSG